jgi:hypothetical protein
MWTLDTTLRTLVLGMLLSCIGACEPEAPANAGKTKPDVGKSDAGGKAADSGKATSEPLEPETAEPAKPAEPTRESCLADCEETKLSEDDRATCRLLCGGALAPKHPLLGAYLGCHDGCVDKSADDRPTCHKNCAASVTAGTGDPATTACPRGCTEAFGSCLSPCEDKNEDDTATCRKQCEVIAEKCVVGCG